MMSELRQTRYGHMNAYLISPAPLTRIRHYIVGCALLGGPAYLLARAPIGLAVAILAAVLAGTIVISSPAAGIVLVAAAIPFGRLIPMPLPGLDLVDVLTGFALLAWLLRGMANRRIVFQPPPLMWPLLAFVWICGLSLTQALSWREGVTEWMKWVEFAALYLVGAQILSRRSKWALIAALFLAGLAQAGIGAYQFLHQVGPKAFVLSGGFMRAYGTFQQPNPYAGYLGYLTPVATGLALAAGGRWWANRRPSDLVIAAACAIVAAALGAGILMSWSRGAWIALIASMATVVALLSRRTAALALGAVLLLVLATAMLGVNWLPGSVVARISDLVGTSTSFDLAQTAITDANFSILERLAHWQAGIQMFADHPWLGIGIGNFGVAYAAYALPHWYDPLGHAHNIFINILAETGVLGLGTFGLFWLSAGWCVWRHAIRGDGYPRALALGILGTWVYLSVHSAFDNLFVQHIQLQLALLLAVMMTRTSEPS